MNNIAKLAFGVAAVAVVAVVGINLLPGGGAGVGGGSTVSPSPEPSPSTSPPSPSPEASPSPMPSSSPAPSPSEQPSPSPVAGPTTLAASDVGRTLPPGIYRVASPFGKPFTIALNMDWKLEGLSRTAASFTDARAETAGAIGIEVALAGSVYPDPCHRGGPLQTPVPTTVDGMVEALTDVVGFTVTTIADESVGFPGAAKAFRLENDESNRAGCDIDYDLIWVVDVDATPVVIRGTSFHRIAAGGLTLQDAVKSISFD